jgi:hypothetical protein
VDDGRIGTEYPRPDIHIHKLPPAHARA